MLVATLPDGTLVSEDDASEMYELITEEIHHLHRLLHDVEVLECQLWKVQPVCCEGQTSIAHLPVIKQNWRNDASLRRIVRDHWLPQPREMQGRAADRLLGWLKLSGETDAVANVRNSIASVNDYKSRFALYNRTLLPDSAARTRYLRRQYPGIIMRSVHRRIELANDSDYRSYFAWSRAQYRATPVDVKYVEDLLEAQRAANPEFDIDNAKNQLARRLSDPSRFQLVHVADIRVHPVQGIVYRDSEGVRRVRPVKCHSPLVITNNNQFVNKPPSDFVFSERPLSQRQPRKKQTIYHPILPLHSIFQREIKSD